MRKITQIVIDSSGNLIALCNDNSLWRRGGAGEGWVWKLISQAGMEDSVSNTPAVTPVVTPVVDPAPVEPAVPLE